MGDEELEKKVLSEINMDHKSLEEGVKHLIEWLSKQPHLPRTTDESLLKAFIVGSKSVERAKEKLDKYFTARTKYPDVFSSKNRDPRLLQYHKAEKMAFLPGLTAEGYNVVYMTPPQTKEETEAFTVIETAKVFFMMNDLMLRSTPLTAGQIVVINAAGLTMEYLTRFVTSFTATAFDLYQNVLPVRMKACVVFNSSSVAEIFCNKILKVMLSEKLSQRVFVHHDDEKALSKYFPKEMLPNDLGGNSRSWLQLWDETKERLEENRDWLMTEGCEGSDERKRPKTDKDSEQLQGTFRKLEID